MKIHHLYDEVYNFKCNLILDCSLEELKDVVEKQTKSKWDDYYIATGETLGWFISNSEADLYFIWFKKGATVSTIIHETFHFICKILRQSGVSFCEESEEVYAYMLCYWFNKIVVLVNK